tara:strand:- start:204 stop:1001 length:798 start_codon:yes stop_codon:yes gene_type:complete
MADYQKFIFSEDYSTEPEILRQKEEKKLVEAKQLMADEIEKAKQFAFEQGFQEGQKMALEKLKSEMDTHLNTLIQSIQQINNFKPELHDLYEKQSTACVRHLVSKLYFKSNEIIPDTILNQAVENALENLPMVASIVIKVPRNCKNYLQDTLIEEKVQQAGITDYRILEDLTLGDGQCLIEWDKSGVLSSKVEAFEKINSTLNAFISEEDLELSDNTTSLYQTPEQEAPAQEAIQAEPEQSPEEPENPLNEAIQQELMQDQNVAN